MRQDRSNWTVRKVTFAEAEALDDDYYARLTSIERLEILFDLRSRIGAYNSRIEPVVSKRHIHEQEEV